MSRHKSRLSSSRPSVPRKSRRGGAGGGLLPWLGLGVLGAATFWLTRRPVGEPRAGRSVHGPSPETSSTEPSLATEPSLTELPPDVQVSWIPAPSGSLRVVERFPKAPLAIVFVHGLAGRLEHWSPQIRALGSGLRVIAMDLPGHGESDADTEGDYSIAALASSLGAVLDSCGLRRAVVVAHSLGALAALEYAGRHPGRVQGLLLLDPSGDQSQSPPAGDELEALRSEPRAECEMHFRYFLMGSRPEVGQRVMADLASTPEATLVGALLGLPEARPLEALAKYNGPVQSVASECNDSAISLHRLRPDLPVRFIPRAGHWLMMDQPEEVLEALWDFLEEVRR